MEDRATCQEGTGSSTLANNIPKTFFKPLLVSPGPDSCGNIHPIKHPIYPAAADEDDVAADNFEISLEGCSPSVLRIKDLIKKVAQTSASVLILGESGTGKEVAAREIHRNSLRRNMPFVPINCGAIPADLLESELFGHEKGAFTGALTSRAGRFELAEGGTLFLDEIGDMTLEMQVKLLRVLQEHTFERVGSNKTRVADVRIIAATHRNLEERILDNLFREDLYYRLNVFPIEMPSLRDRREDIPSLLNSILNRLKKERGIASFSDRTVQVLQSYSWPGNIRELANLVERLCILYPGEAIETSHLPEKFFSGATISGETLAVNYMPDLSSPMDWIEKLTLSDSGIDLKELLTQLELHYIKLALNQSDGVVARAAKLLNLGRTTLVEKLRKYEIDRAA